MKPVETILPLSSDCQRKKYIRSFVNMYFALSVINMFIFYAVGNNSEGKRLCSH